jgi:hypothetical protein
MRCGKRVAPGGRPNPADQNASARLAYRHGLHAGLRFDAARVAMRADDDHAFGGGPLVYDVASLRSGILYDRIYGP